MNRSQDPRIDALDAKNFSVLEALRQAMKTCHQSPCKATRLAAEMTIGSLESIMLSDDDLQEVALLYFGPKYWQLLGEYEPLPEA